MKTLTTKISSESNSQNYDINGNENGQTSSMNFRIIISEDNTEVGNINISIQSNYYNNQSDEEFISAKEALEAKIKAAIDTFDETIKAI